MRKIKKVYLYIQFGSEIKRSYFLKLFSSAPKILSSRDTAQARVANPLLTKSFILNISSGVHSNIQPRARHNVNSRACATTPQQPLARAEIEFTFAIWHLCITLSVDTSLEDCHHITCTVYCGHDTFYNLIYFLLFNPTYINIKYYSFQFGLVWNLSIF